MKQEGTINLEKMIKKLIAKKEGITPEDVTLGYIEEQRKKRFYPITRYNIGSNYGGYNKIGLTFLTRNELDKIHDSIEYLMRNC